MPVTLSVAAAGQGPRTALLLHGLGSRGADLDAVAGALGAEWRVLLPDLRGHGDSPARPAPEALEDIVADVDALAVTERPELIAGFSFGARIALALWSRPPEGRPAAVALVDPMLRWGPLLAWASQGGAGEEEMRRRLMALYDAPTVPAAEALMREHPLTRDLDDAGRERNARALLAADRATLRRISDWPLPPPDRTPPPAPASAGPLLVLHGSGSPVCPADRATALAGALGGRAQAYDGGHCAQFEAPVEIAAALRALADGAR